MSVLAIFIPMTVAREEAHKNAETNETGNKDENLGTNLAQLLSIQYPISFQKQQSVLALLDSRCEINAIHLIFAKELSLFIRPTDVEA